MAEIYDITNLVKQATAGQDTSSSAEVKISSGEAASTKSKSGDWQITNA